MAAHRRGAGHGRQHLHHYALILAAIGPIAMVVGQQVFGSAASVHVETLDRLFRRHSRLHLSLVLGIGVYVASPRHRRARAELWRHQGSGQGAQGRGLCVDRRSGSPGSSSSSRCFLDGCLIGGLYGLYLLYLGLPRLMRVTEDKAVGYTVVVIVVQIVIYFVFRLHCRAAGGELLRLRR